MALLEALGVVRAAGVDSAAFEECCASEVAGKNKTATRSTKPGFFINHLDGLNVGLSEAILWLWISGSNGNFR
jgi:hypothetical protein